jgi:hypothetical protein
MTIASPSPSVPPVAAESETTIRFGPFVLDRRGDVTLPLARQNAGSMN